MESSSSSFQSSLSHSSSPRLTLPDEPPLVWWTKGFLHELSLCLYLFFFTSPWAFWSALFAGGLGLALAKKWGSKLSRKGLILSLILTLVAAWISSSLVGELDLFSFFMTASTQLKMSDSAYFFCLSLGGLFCLRSWGQQSRTGSLFEALVMIGSVVQLFSAHREGQIHEPRFFTDWVMIQGTFSLSEWYFAFGFGAALLIFFAFVRVRRTLHFTLATLLLILLAYGITFLWGGGSLPVEKAEPLSLGGKGKGQKGKGKGEGKEGEGEGDGDSDSQNNSSNSNPPRPVALAVFHDDYAPETGILYFRQQVLSSFDGTKLVADQTGLYDRDVLVDFPHQDALEAAPAQNPDAHLLIPTSMFLLQQHPTPPTLTHGRTLIPLENPAPQNFVSAYKVISQVPSVPVIRHLGKSSIPFEWSEKQRQHYLQTPNDPRYTTLAREITRELPPHMASDSVRKAYAIKKYLEKNGFYTRKVKYASQSDPAAAFLFGDLRGYCVHFAHSAVHLLRSLGIAARVALGYAVDTRMRSNSSAVIIYGDRAHAWPEIHVEGVGWVTFDIYPENSDEPPPSLVSQSLESLFGEIARNQEQRGYEPSYVIPWRQIGIGGGLFALFLILFGYIISLWRWIRLWIASDEQKGSWAYVLMLDRLASIGLNRHFGESREAYALRLQDLSPQLTQLTQAHLQWALGHPQKRQQYGQEVDRLSKEVRMTYARTHRGKWLIGCLNPWGWIRSR